MPELLLQYDFVWRALLGGVGVALVAGPLGCFVVWRRMAYFGASLSHSALLGVALGAALSLSYNAAIVAVFVVFTLLLVWLEQRRGLATDTVLGILSHAALSAGLVTLSFMEWLRVDLMGYLFGDILAVRDLDLVWIYGGGAVVLVGLVLLWQRLMAVTVHEELARAEGVPVTAVHLAFLLLMALVIVIAMKIVGILLIVSLLIIPPAAARRFARTPEQMAALSAVLGVVAVLSGMAASVLWDTPSGPSIVLAATALFVLTLVRSVPGTG